MAILITYDIDGPRAIDETWKNASVDSNYVTERDWIGVNAW